MVIGRREEGVGLGDLSPRSSQQFLSLQNTPSATTICNKPPDPNECHPAGTSKYASDPMLVEVFP